MSVLHSQQHLVTSLSPAKALPQNFDGTTNSGRNNFRTFVTQLARLWPGDANRLPKDGWKIPQIRLRSLFGFLGILEDTKVEILRGCNGLIQRGELPLVLGRPGSGCTTLLKTITGETHGISIGKESQLNYQGSRPVRGLEDGFTKLYSGFDQNMIQSTYRGSVSYLAELDVHFPTLTVGETLVIAKRARTPAEVPLPIQKGRTAGLDEQEESVTSLGLSPALGTRVGNEFVPGVNGGGEEATKHCRVTSSPNYASMLGQQYPRPG